jgi:signal transduction histidine kinase
MYEQKIMIYRIIQELCSNTIKHADASQVEIELIKNKNELCLKYKDNGKGFNSQKNNKGIGLKGILSRIEYYGGKFVLKSKVEKGIEVLINLPIN